MTRVHTYDTVVTRTGNRGTGTSGYRHYDRAHEVTADSPAKILGSSDPPFRGDPSRWNPEQLLVAALSQCHMLWYLHQCADAGVVVTGYVDHAHGINDRDRRGWTVHRGGAAPGGQCRVLGDGGCRDGPARRRPSGLLHRQLGEFPRPPRAPCAGGGRVIFPMPWDGASGDVADQALRLSTAGADRPTDA